MPEVLEVSVCDIPKYRNIFILQEAGGLPFIVSGLLTWIIGTFLEDSWQALPEYKRFAIKNTISITPGFVGSALVNIGVLFIVLGLVLVILQKMIVYYWRNKIERGDCLKLNGRWYVTDGFDEITGWRVNLIGPFKSRREARRYLCLNEQ